MARTNTDNFDDEEKSRAAEIIFFDLSVFVRVVSVLVRAKYCSCPHQAARVRKSLDFPR